MTKEYFKFLYDQHFDAIRNYIYFRSGNEELATDITQEVFFTIWNKQIKGEVLKALLYKIANDLFVNTIRKNKAAENYATDFKLQFSETEEEDDHLQEMKQKYERALAKLSDKHRTVFLMHKIEGRSYKEIAESLKLSVKAIEKRMSVALKQIKEEIKK